MASFLLNGHLILCYYKLLEHLKKTLHMYKEPLSPLYITP